MITFNLQAHNGNYYRGHEPCNHSGNCWTDEEVFAMVFTIDQVRKIMAHDSAVSSNLNITISIKSNPITDDECDREIFCLDGGYYYDWKGA